MPPKKKPTIELDSVFTGRVPPQAEKIENALLGAIMLHKDAFDLAYNIIKPECLYLEVNQIMFRAMEAMYNNNQPIDLLTVTDRLTIEGNLDKIGGVHHLINITKNVQLPDIEFYSRIIYEKYIKRKIILTGSEMVKEAYEESDPFDLIDQSEKKIGEINLLEKNKFNHVSKGLVNVIKRMDELIHTKEVLTGAPTGFYSIDALTSGWQSPDFILLAARPSVGKTAFSLNLAIAALQKIPVGYFSLEMTEQQLIQRIISIESGTFLKKITHGKLTEEERNYLNPHFSRISQMKLFIDDTPSPTVYQLRSKARRMKKDHGIGIMFIDYLQLMSGIQNGRADNREQEISKISRDLKSLTKELGIPIIALSQLSRDLERRPGKKMPQLSDLRESGALEQDADIVMFMYRPEYYDINTDEKGNNIEGLTELRFSKHRSGPLETVRLKANLPNQRFSDWEQMIPASTEFAHAKQNGFNFNDEEPF